jgi:beta-lactamase superfamily II metal-dependent hydrolase
MKRYHFLEKNVQKRYQMEAVLAYNTADNGAVSFNFDPQGKISPVSTVRQEVTWQAELEK